MLQRLLYELSKMASLSDDRVPLLGSENPSYEPYGLSLKTSSQQSAVQHVCSAVASTLVVDDTLPKQNIISIFVVAFDIRAGNVIEWCVPEDCDLNGIEFKAMASGSHRIDTDFIYFKKNSMFGFACFENMPIESEIERGARMKSVGVMSSSYANLHLHMDFLQEQVKQLLRRSGEYDQLRSYYEKWKAVIPSTPLLRSIRSLTYRNKYYADMKMTHPTNCFSQYVKFFGEQIFLLWKFALLRKRILFFSPPPIGVVCYRVYCTSCLALHNVPELPEKVSQPLFYVSVADIDSIESHVHYVACTTEKIFETKEHLFDVYVDNQNIRMTSQLLRKMMTVSPADKENMRRLQGRFRELNLFCMGSTEDEEAMFVEFFTDINNNLFRTLIDVSYSDQKYLSLDNIRSLGLDPSVDREFILELIETYNIDLVLEDDNSCCSVFYK